jgi:hypothetical protein
MKLQIYLTEEIATALLTVSERERRDPRQQVVFFVEKALEAARLHPAKTRCGCGHAMESESRDASAR